MTAQIPDLLANQKEEIRQQALQSVASYGVKESDPIYLLMLSLLTVKVLIDQAPDALKKTFTDCQQEARQEYEGYERAALAGIKEQVANTVNQLVEDSLAKAKESKNVVTYKSLIGAGAMMLAVLLVGGLSGLGYARWIAQMDRRGLTANEVKALDFAQSKEGRYAQQLMGWNQDLLDGGCQERVRDLGPIRVGDRKAASGFCFVWVKPPQDRTFAER